MRMSENVVQGNAGFSTMHAPSTPNPSSTRHAGCSSTLDAVSMDQMSEICGTVGGLGGGNGTGGGDGDGDDL